MSGLWAISQGKRETRKEVGGEHTTIKVILGGEEEKGEANIDHWEGSLIRWDQSLSSIGFGGRILQVIYFLSLLDKLGGK